MKSVKASMGPKAFEELVEAVRAKRLAVADMTKERLAAMMVVIEDEKNSDAPNEFVFRDGKFYFG